jgi:hypothetical protein
MGKFPLIKRPLADDSKTQIRSTKFWLTTYPIFRAFSCFSPKRTIFMLVNAFVPGLEVDFGTSQTHVADHEEDHNLRLELTHSCGSVSFGGIKTIQLSALCHRRYM